jgi:thiol-disulfide isomerase/thioredoxin
MKTNILGFLLLFFLNDSTDSKQEIFLSNVDDVYLKASFNKEADLEIYLDNEVNSKFQNSFEEEFSEDFDIPLQYENLKTSNVDTWELMLFERRNDQMKFLKSYEQFGELSQELIELTQANINYHYWHLLLAYSINRSNENTSLKQVTSLPRIMTESLNPEKINNPNRLLSKSYRAFLPFFVIYFNSENKNFKKYADKVLSMNDKAEYASKYLSGEVLDYTLSRLLELNHKAISSTSFTYWASQIYCENLQNYLTLTYYEDVINAENDRKERLDLAEKEKLKDTKLPTIMDLSDVAFTFEKYKGKVIYVDFWASWCGPCRQQFPYSKKMHEALSEKEKKDIVFLYISIDQDLDKWRGAVEKLGLEAFGENGHSYEVAGKYGVSSIPRYMIIDKKGKVVNDKAPRPSNPETLPALLELL